MSLRSPVPGVVVTPLENGAVLLNLATRSTYTLNASGYRIWRSLARGGSPETTAQRLVEAFAVEPERARASVDRLRGQLLEAGLLLEDPR